MALIVRIDVDRPYGKNPLGRHLLSRLSSDLWFPRVNTFGYLKELQVILELLNKRNARSYLFFRRCTLPSERIMQLIEDGQHEIGVHLENSRSFETFFQEKQLIERHTGRKVFALSKHGSGKAKYGYRHHAPYEPERYIEWARQSQMKVFFGNLEDPSIRPNNGVNDFIAFPSAFWLEPDWRDTSLFPVDWLLREARKSDVVLLLHPENVLEKPELTEEFARLVTELPTKILS